MTAHDERDVETVAEAICGGSTGCSPRWHHDTARAVLDALDLPGRERRAKAEGIREAVARVRWVYDLQCPVPTTGRYHKWARLAHLWWQKVLGGELERLSRRAAEIDPEEGDHE